jgi:hypothetical protein
MKALEGHFVRAVEEIETSITLVLDTDARLVIDLHRDVFRTPEAIVLEREGDEAVVWP